MPAPPPVSSPRSSRGSEPPSPHQTRACPCLAEKCRSRKYPTSVGREGVLDSRIESRPDAPNAKAVCSGGSPGGAKHRSRCRTWEADAGNPPSPEAGRVDASAASGRVGDAANTPTRSGPAMRTTPDALTPHPDKTRYIAALVRPLPMGEVDLTACVTRHCRGSGLAGPGARPLPTNTPPALHRLRIAGTLNDWRKIQTSKQVQRLIRAAGFGLGSLTPPQFLPPICMSFNFSKPINRRSKFQDSRGLLLHFVQRTADLISHLRPDQFRHIARSHSNVVKYGPYRAPGVLDHVRREVFVFAQLCLG